jgi:hypothetical protein
MKWLKDKWCDWFHGGGRIKRDCHGRINWQCDGCGRWGEPVDLQTERRIVDADIRKREREQEQEQKQEQEPIAWLTDREEMYFDEEDAMRSSDRFIQPLYPKPTQRKWQKITDHEADEYWDESINTGCRISFGIGVDYANRVLRERNK